MGLPETIETSRSCDWIKTNELKWFSWIVEKPQCDASFYAYRVSTCDSRAKRQVTYYWLLASPTDASKSSECQGGVDLPPSVEIDCEYAPHEAPVFKTVTAIAAVLAAVLVCMIGFVVLHRDSPIIKRSQYEFLVVMLVGGVLMCAATLLYAGAPTKALCGLRPATVSVAFTLIFGALVVKSLRVYRVFMSGAMKRVVLSTRTMFRILGLFVLVDVVILAAWFVVDFPQPALKLEEMAVLRGGSVERLVCQSSSFIFSALLIFWKTIVLFMGLYLSFLIRNVSTDFQESVWIFASAVVVLFGSVIVLPMAYLRSSWP
ncbi:hypothetical protein P43SY_010870 [Pythium insidiosum]|uniref:G-protein coupled receptors family 3 profile domain-containing protein n=1 Tax=Pythium insidiosum TaxID=114742 RepID=A0AAD5Q114_PYTIN|nr:hypothetical protein P43SY_010870 [Pythium insidiosum]